jgi:hypothetical protein
VTGGLLLVGHRRRKIASRAIVLVVRRSAVRFADLDKHVRVWPTTGIDVREDDWVDDSRDAAMSEIPLAGGAVNAVVRVGDTVRRPPGPRSVFVRDLLQLFEQRGWSGAPRYLGRDDQGREMLSYLDGHVPWRDPASTRSDASVVRVAEMMREFHDLTAGSTLAGSEETVCHNDLSPKNTVYRDDLPIMFIDWDIAAPGRRIHDVAHVAWQYLGLGPSVPDVDETSRRLRLICDAYGLDERGELIDTVLWWQDRCWRGIEAKAVDDAAMRALRDDGVPAAIRSAYAWVTEHRVALAADL